MTPNKKVKIPMYLENKKSLSVTANGKPGVVFIKISVIANTAIRKQPADTVAAFRILVKIASSFSETNSVPMIVMENPQSKELIKIN